MRTPPPEKSRRGAVDPMLSGPQSIEAEQAVLGSLLISLPAIRTARERLLPSDFAFAAHRKVWDAVIDLADQGVTPDLLTVPEELRRRGQLESIGGQEYMNTLVESVPTASQVEHYARIVARKAQLRGLIDLGRTIAGRAMDGDDPETELEFAQSGLEALRSSRPDGSARGLLSVQELLAMELPPVRWAVPNLIPEGLTILAAPPKTGKSWLSLGLMMAIAAGGRVLGEIEVEAGAVLGLMLEDTVRRLKNRIQQLAPEGVTVRQPFDVVTEWSTWPDGGGRALDRWLREHPTARLVVIDTLEKWRGVRPDSGNIYSEDYQMMSALKAIADRHQVAIVVIHHFRKRGGKDQADEIEAISGTMALAGAADCNLLLHRDKRRDGGSREAVLVVGGRDVEDQRLALRFDNLCAWVLEGEAAAVHRSREEEAVIELIRERNSWLSPVEIAKGLGISSDAARQRVFRMKKRSILVESGGAYAIDPTYAETVSRESRVSRVTLSRQEGGCDTVTRDSRDTRDSKNEVSADDPGDPAERLRWLVRQRAMERGFPDWDAENAGGELAWSAWIADADEAWLKAALQQLGGDDP